jgi:hypothetical protein
MLGRSLEHVIGSSIGDLVAPRSRGAFDALARAARAGGAKGEVFLDRAGRGEIPGIPGPTSPGVLGLVTTDLSASERGSRSS